MKWKKNGNKRILTWAIGFIPFSEDQSKKWTISEVEWQSIRIQCLTHKAIRWEDILFYPL